MTGPAITGWVAERCVQLIVG